jgi:hypothetical protein
MIAVLTLPASIDAAAGSVCCEVKRVINFDSDSLQGDYIDFDIFEAELLVNGSYDEGAAKINEILNEYYGDRFVWIREYYNTAFPYNFVRESDLREVFPEDYRQSKFYDLKSKQNTLTDAESKTIGYPIKLNSGNIVRSMTLYLELSEKDKAKKEKEEKAMFMDRHRYLHRRILKKGFSDIERRDIQDLDVGKAGSNWGACQWMLLCVYYDYPCADNLTERLNQFKAEILRLSEDNTYHGKEKLNRQLSIAQEVIAKHKARENKK